VSGLPVLVIDMDGTLLRSDLLFESFWSACGRDWRSPVPAARALLRGRAALKRCLAGMAALDPATLPYDPAVIAYVDAWRERGGRAALVTAGDQTLARLVAGHLGLFDEVHGSDGVRNLKGAAKAEFLGRRFAATGYAYMGDAWADLPVWQKARRAITVNAPAALRARVEALGREFEHLTTASAAWRPYLDALRPHQWLKNLLVFVPMLAAHRLDLAAAAPSLLAFAAFALVASGAYVMNDLVDLAADRAHPRKRTRPFASGRVPIAHGTWMAVGLVLGGGAVAATVGPDFLLVVLAYVVVTAAYSSVLKRHAVVDICVLAGLYTLRLIAGGVATGISLSVWLLAFSIFFFLSLAAVKRHAELVDNARRRQSQPVGRGYHVDDLPLVSQMAIGSGYVSVLVLALYLTSPDVTELYAEPAMLWGICPILLYWLSRMVMVAHRGGMHDDPIVFAVKDRTSWICGGLVLGFATAGALW